MNISSLNITITSLDLLGILKDVIKEFVPFEGLEIESVNLDNKIFVNGSYKNKVKIRFQLCLDICSVVNNMVKVKIIQIKVGKIKVFKFITSFALKKFMAKLSKYGIFVDKEYIVIALDKLYEFIPGVKFNVLSINTDKALKVEVSTLDIDLKELLKKENNEREIKTLLKDKVQAEDEIIDNRVQKEEKTINDKKLEICYDRAIVEDSYTKVREEILEKTPKKFEGLVKYSMIIPDLITLFIRLFKDKRVPVKTKVTVGGIIAYLTCPIDIFPDFIPVVGKTDDVVVAFFGLNKILNDVDEKVILDNWQGEDNIINIIKEGVYYISKAIGSEKIARILKVVKAKKIFIKREVKKGAVGKKSKR
ncbi:YkvA family protein [Haloimpatiens sp. FM7315]|uniref:YkvA family protein n=1 Tax=Haloimpatiens sp. FM7315 TaxID=3298609 RepID=UPI00370AD796